jgi:hypothetical protein
MGGGPDAGARDAARPAVAVTAEVPWPAMAAAVCAALAFGTGGALWPGEHVSTGIGGGVALGLTVAGIAVLAKLAPAAVRAEEGA